MEGLIPFLLHAIKKEKPHHNSFRCLSETCNRSYHMLIGGDSIEGSSHRRTRSEFQPSVTVDFFDLPQNRSFNNRAASLLSPVSNKNGSRLQFGTNKAATNNLQGNTVDSLRHRKF
ncbi:unnamed protein product [Withania somnifera]